MMVNFGEAAASFDPAASMVIPKGEYEVRIDSAEATTAQSSGREMIKCVFVVEGGPQDGRKVYNNFVWVPEKEGAVRMFFIQMAVLGLDKAYFLKSPSMDQVAHDITGKRCRITVDHREWQGEPQADVKRIKASQGGAGVPQFDKAPAPTSQMAPAPTNAAPSATPQPSATPSPTPTPAPSPTPQPAAEAPKAEPASEPEAAPAQPDTTAVKPPLNPPF